MNPAKDELAQIVEAHELSDQARIALEKLVSSLVKEKKNAQEKLATTVDEAEGCKRESLAANSEATRLRIENESLAQRLSGKDNSIARLQGCVSSLEANLLKQQVHGYNVPMIQDFLDQLMSDLRCVIWENEHANATNSEFVGKQQKYMERYGQLGGFVPVAIREAGESPQRKELLAQYKPELAALELLAPRLQFALEAASRPKDTFVINVTEPDKSHWLRQSDFLKRLKA